jgi:hypothetical protein
MPAWNDRRLQKMFAAEALIMLIARLAGGRIWRLQKRLTLAGCLLGVVYGLLMELDERRKRPK